MNDKQFFAAIAAAIFPIHLCAWHGEQIEISKGVKSYTIVVRNYEPEEWATINTRVTEEGFYQLSCVHNVSDGRIKISPRTFDSLKFSRTMQPMSVDELYDFFKSYFESPLPTTIHSSCHEGTCHKGVYNHCTDIFINEPEHEHDSKLSREMLNNAKIAMQRIAGEDAGIRYQELRFERQGIVGQEEKPGFWQQLKDMVWNKKFFLAVGMLGAMYVGYKYAKNHALFQYIQI